MARSRKTTIVYSQLILWGGILLTTLIATYGPHGPARHPKFIPQAVLLVGMMAVLASRPYCSHNVLGTIIGLLVVAFFVSALVPTVFADALPPSTTAIVLIVCGLNGSATVAFGRVEDPVPNESNVESLQESESE